MPADVLCFIIFLQVFVKNLFSPILHKCTVNINHMNSHISRCACLVTRIQIKLQPLCVNRCCLLYNLFESLSKIGANVLFNFQSSLNEYASHMKLKKKIITRTIHTQIQISTYSTNQSKRLYFRSTYWFTVQGSNRLRDRYTKAIKERWP